MGCLSSGVQVAGLSSYLQEDDKRHKKEKEDLVAELQAKHAESMSHLEIELAGREQRARDAKEVMRDAVLPPAAAHLVLEPSSRTEPKAIELSLTTSVKTMLRCL